MNLMANALKFTPRGGTISIGVRGVDHEVEVAVADTGPGITADEMPLLFERFSQTELGKSSPVSGTGLGLVICRHIVEAHGGRIWAESEPGQGTRFVFRLARAGDARRQSRRVLIVDDEPDLARILADWLRDRGHDTEMAGNGALALEKLQQGSYDAIVTDIRMPELDGIGLYRALERCAPGMCRRLIFVTGYGLGPEVADLVARTNTPCLEKPFPLERIEGLVAAVCAERPTAAPLVL